MGTTFKKYQRENSYTRTGGEWAQSKAYLHVQSGSVH